MLEASIALIAAALGAVLGFWLSERQRRRVEQERAAQVRRMLRAEIKLNLELLDSATEELPSKSTQLWSSQLAEIPGALDSDTLEKVHSFYMNLHRIHVLNDEAKRTERKIRSSDVRKAIAALLKDGNPLE